MLVDGKVACPNQVNLQVFNNNRHEVQIGASGHDRDALFPLKQLDNLGDKGAS